MNCGLFRRHLDAFLDGEVDPATQIDFERHAMACAGCQELTELERALRARVKDSLRGVPAPAALRDRICASLAAAPAPAPGPGSAPVRDGMLRNGILRARYSVPIGLAAAAALAFGYV